MLDLVFVVLTVVFFALCWALIALCEQLGESGEKAAQNARASK